MNWVEYKFPHFRPNLKSPRYSDDKKRVWSKAVQSVLQRRSEVEIPALNRELVNYVAEKLCRKFALRITALGIESGVVRQFQAIPEGDNYKAHPLNKLANAARKVGLFTDFSLRHNGTHWPCHRAVLEAKSSQYEADIPADIPSQSVDIFLNYLYEDPYKIPNGIDRDVLIGLGCLAKQFDLPFLAKIVKQRETYQREAFGFHFSFEEELYSVLKGQLRNQEAFSWRYKPVLNSRFGLLYQEIVKRLQAALKDKTFAVFFEVPLHGIQLTDSLRLFYQKAFKVKIGVDLTIKATEQNTVQVEAFIEKDNPVLLPLIEKLNAERHDGFPYHKFLLQLKGIGRQHPLNMSIESDYLLHYLYEQPLPSLLDPPTQRAFSQVASENQLPFLSQLLTLHTRAEVMAIQNIATLKELQEAVKGIVHTSLHALVNDRLLELEQNLLNKETPARFRYLGATCKLQFGIHTLKIDGVILSSLLEYNKDLPKIIPFSTILSEAETLALKRYFGRNGHLPKSLSKEQLDDLQKFATECGLPSLTLEIEKRSHPYSDIYLNGLLNTILLLSRRAAKTGSKQLDAVIHISSENAMEDSAIFSLVQPLLKYRYGIFLESFTFIRPSSCSGKLYSVKANWHSDNLKVFTLKMRFQQAHAAQQGDFMKIICRSKTFYCHTTLLQNAAANFPFASLSNKIWHTQTSPQVMEHFINSLYSDEKLPDDHLSDDHKIELSCLKDMLNVD